MKHTVTGQSDTPHRSPAAALVASRSSTSAFVEFTDDRPEAVAQRRLAEAIHNSPSMVAQRRQLRGLFGEAAQLKGGPEEEELLQKKVAPVQRREPEDEKLLQGKFEVRQRKGLEEEEPLQGKMGYLGSDLVLCITKRYACPARLVYRDLFSAHRLAFHCGRAYPRSIHSRLKTRQPSRASDLTSPRRIR